MDFVTPMSWYQIETFINMLAFVDLWQVTIIMDQALQV